MSGCPLSRSPLSRSPLSPSLSGRHRYAIALFCAALGLSGCPRPKQPAKRDGPKPAVLHTHGQLATLPETAPPAAGAPAIVRAPRYVPNDDPQNKAGFAFRVKRRADDASDRKKKPFTIETLYRTLKVGAPHFAPDGKQILFSLTSYKLEQGKTNVDIWVVDADGKRPARRLTRHPGYDYQPRWAPDGRSFLFLSSRKDGVQVWRMPIDGGEPEQLTSLSTGIGQAEWLPDGKHIAVSSQIFPEHGADAKANKAALEARKSNPLKAHLADDLFYRHWTSWRDGRRWHVLLLTLEGKAKERWRDLTPGDYDSPALHANPGYALSPDGKELCFVSNRQTNKSARAWTTNKDLWAVPTAGGAAINLTAGNPGADAHPAYSPDGKQIAFIRQGIAGYESAARQLALYDRKSGKTRILTGGFDNWVLDFVWASNGRSLVFRGAERGRFPLYRVEVASGKVTRLTVSSRGFDVGPKGRLAFSFDRVDAPLELFVSDARGKASKRLTNFNRALRDQVDFRPVEELWIAGHGGTKVHTFVVKPHGFRKGKRYPLIINVHGGPQYQWADNFRGDWQVYPGSGYIVAYLNPHGSIGYGQAYTAAISKDYGGKVFSDIAKVRAALGKLPYVDAKRIGAMGWSWGGYAMAWLAGHETAYGPDRGYKALAAMMPVYDLRSFYGTTEELWFPEWDIGGMPWKQPEAYRKQSPSISAGEFKTPTLVLTGERDYRVPYTQGLQLFTALRRQGIPSRLIVFENDGHWPSVVKSMPLYYAAHLDWFARYLGGGGSPWKLSDLVRGTAFSKKK
jgi:dipeptidyl aminopeptidase/acylaminoacyl peptidase